MLDVQSITTYNTAQPQQTNKQDPNINKDNQTMVTQETLPSSLNFIQVSHNNLEVSGIKEDSIKSPSRNSNSKLSPLILQS
jgi:hypothetical protein